MKTGKFAFVLMAVLVLSISMAGCMPYDTPEFVEVGPSETAFVIPLEGQTSDQKMFQSEEYLKKHQVAEKRIRIPHRWVQTGRMPSEGKFMPTVIVIKVNRAPVSREWTESGDTGTSVKNQALRAESRESMGFTARMNCTAEVTEENGVRFLYKYHGRQLEEIMDSEIRNRIQGAFTETASSFRLQDITPAKGKMMAYIRKQNVAYFEKQGITITQLGFEDEFTYPENIQAAINEVFLSAQRLRAQRDESQRVREEALAKAQSLKETAAAQAQAARIMNDTSKMRYQREVWKHEEEMERLKKWDGAYPQVIAGRGSGVMLTLPAMQHVVAQESAPTATETQEGEQGQEEQPQPQSDQ